MLSWKWSTAYSCDPFVFSPKEISSYMNCEDSYTISLTTVLLHLTNIVVTFFGVCWLGFHQVNAEMKKPIHMELMPVISQKRGMVCQSVSSEFQELVSMCGGPNERSRAEHFLNRLRWIFYKFQYVLTASFLFLQLYCNYRYIQQYMLCHSLPLFTSRKEIGRKIRIACLL